MQPEPIYHKNPSPRTGPHDLLATHYDSLWRSIKQKLQKYANNLVTQYESEPQDTESTTLLATFKSKARATTLTGYKFAGKFSENKVHCSQVSNGIKSSFDHESFYQNRKERQTSWPWRFFKKKDANCSQILTDKDESRKIVKFWVFPVSAHQQQLEHHHGHIQLDDKFPYHGAHGRLACDYMINIGYPILD